MRAGVYCRSSHPWRAVSLLEPQRADCCELARSRGWEPVLFFEDDGRSAYRGDPRPGYRGLCEAIAGGLVDAVVAWHPDRLHRDLRELEAFVDLVNRAGVLVATVKTGPVDLSSATGRLSARVVGVVARHESEQMGERIAAEKRQRARRGLAQGGGRPYGYRRAGPGRLEVVESEAAVIREMADRIRAGESAMGVAAALNDRGVPTAGSGRWRHDSVWRVLTSARVAGLSSSGGKVVAAAGWPAILDGASRERLVAERARRARRRTKSPTARRADGLLDATRVRCGRCGAKLWRRPNRDGVRCYVCPGRREHACGRLSAVVHGVDTAVADAVLARLDDPEAPWPREPTDRDPLLDLAGLEERLDELESLYAAEEVAKAEYQRARAGLRARRQLALHRLEVAGEELAGGSLRATWPTLSLDQQRRTAARLIDRVVIAPAAGPTPRFSADRLTITWTPSPPPVGTVR